MRSFLLRSEKKIEYVTLSHLIQAADISIICLAHRRVGAGREQRTPCWQPVMKTILGQREPIEQPILSKVISRANRATQKPQMMSRRSKSLETLAQSSGLQHRQAYIPYTSHIQHQWDQVSRCIKLRHIQAGRTGVRYTHTQRQAEACDSIAAPRPTLHAFPSRMLTQRQGQEARRITSEKPPHTSAVLTVKSHRSLRRVVQTARTKYRPGFGA